MQYLSDVLKAMYNENANELNFYHRYTIYESAPIKGDFHVEPIKRKFHFFGKMLKFSLSSQIESKSRTLMKPESR